MNTEQTSNTRKRGLKALLIAALAAVVLLVTIVLPAERGVDPTGIGKLLGLTKMATPATPSAGGALKVEDVTGGNDNLVAAEGGGSMDKPIPLPNPAVHQKEAGAARTETFEIKLGLDEKTEIKAILGKAKALVYHWTVEGGQVYVDFHGHDPSKGDAYWVRYEEVDGTTSGQGSLVAPFDGEHGWFWLNTSEGPITIKLTVTGYQREMKNYGLLQ